MQGKPSVKASKWPNGWWSIVDFKDFGIIPLPIFLILFAVIGGFAATGNGASDILMAIVLLSMGGFTCAELGKKRIPIIRNISAAAAIFATFIPSFHNGLPSPATSLDPGLGDVVHQELELPVPVHLLHVIVGSILGMDRGVLVKGFLQDIDPAGRRIGRRRHCRDAGRRSARPRRLPAIVLLRRFVPIMAGGVGRGRAIPLSIGYSQILHPSRKATCSPRCCRRSCSAA